MAFWSFFHLSLVTRPVWRIGIFEPKVGAGEKLERILLEIILLTGILIDPDFIILYKGWKGFIYMAHAVIDKNVAWNEVNTLTSYDDGNSKTNTLYWVATRP